MLYKRFVFIFFTFLWFTTHLINQSNIQASLFLICKVRLLDLNAIFLNHKMFFLQENKWTKKWWNRYSFFNDICPFDRIVINKYQFINSGQKRNKNSLVIIVKIESLVLCFKMKRLFIFHVPFFSSYHFFSKKELFLQEK